MKYLTKEDLLGLGFKEEYVNAEESGDKPFTYYVYELLDTYGKERCVLITNSDDEAVDGTYYVEFFNMPEIGIFEDYEQINNLIDILKTARNAKQ